MAGSVQSGMSFLKSIVPDEIRQNISMFKNRFRSANLPNPIGTLDVGEEDLTFVIGVGPDFDQQRPDAYTSSFTGFAHGFERLGVPYIFVNMDELLETLRHLPNPFCLLLGRYFRYLTKDEAKALQSYPTVTWVNPWFRGEMEFFDQYDLDARTWVWSSSLRVKILTADPVGFTAGPRRSLGFFHEWEDHGMKMISLPLACDTTIYHPDYPHRERFDDVTLAFVGGYWDTKAKQIDRYLKPFTRELTIYGYNEWPYPGYRGQLSRELEPVLYNQAMVSPTINESTVPLLRGQINERVYKVLGSGGLTVTDAVPPYRDLFTDEELLIPDDEHGFYDMVDELLANPSLREKYRRRGYDAVMSRHTYIHRALFILDLLNLTDRVPGIEHRISEVEDTSDITNLTETGTDGHINR